MGRGAGLAGRATAKAVAAMAKAGAAGVTATAEEAEVMAKAGAAEAGPVVVALRASRC